MVDWKDCGYCDSPSEHGMHERITELESKLVSLQLELAQRNGEIGDATVRLGEESLKRIECERRLDAALVALRCIHNTPPKLSEARERDQDWWIALVDDMMGQASAAIRAAGVERRAPIAGEDIDKGDLVAVRNGWHATKAKGSE